MEAHGGPDSCARGASEGRGVGTGPEHLVTGEPLGAALEWAIDRPQGAWCAQDELVDGFVYGSPFGPEPEQLLQLQLQLQRDGSSRNRKAGFPGARS